MRTNYEIRYAAHPEDAKSYDTKRIRRDFLIEKVFSPNEVNMVYSMYDRMVVGGAMPVGEVLQLEAIDPLKAPYFLTRREMGIFNVGGPGVVRAGDAVFEMDYKEALYLGSGDREVTFESKDEAHPAKFYFNSVTAHRNYPDKKVTKRDAVVAEMGSLEGSNHRNINKMLVNQVLPTCQLQMGMTELAPGSVWNTMPAHVHSRRMEAYFYFEIPEDHAICHFMGEVDETRHVWMKGDQAVLSPEWSIHSAAATHNSCVDEGRPGCPFSRMVYPLCRSYAQLYLYMGYGRRESGLRRPGFLLDYRFEITLFFQPKINKHHESVFEFFSGR